MSAKVLDGFGCYLSEANRARAARSARWTVLGAAAIVLGACTGDIGGTPMSGTGSGPGAGTSGTAGTSTGTSTGTAGQGTTTSTGSTGTGTSGTGTWVPEACNMAKGAFASSRIWQISDEQYWNAVRDVLTVVPPTGSEAEISGATNTTGEFTNLSDSAPSFTDMLAQNYQNAAQRVATQLSAAPKMTELLGSANAATAAQLDTFLSTKVARLWRRPLSAGEITALKNIYNGGTNAADGGPANAFGLLLQAVLQAPSFLFRTEIGPSMTPATAPFKMTPYEIATAVSFMFTNSVPDDTLWAKAVDGTLASADVLGAQIDRLMTLPATQSVLARYVSTYLWIERIPSREKDYTLFPEYTPSVKQALYESGLAFVKEMISSGSLSDLFASNKIHLNKELSTVYGIPGGMGATPTALNLVTSTLPERSGGMLTHPALLAATDKRPALADPIHHGLFVLEELLNGGDVGEIPGPPADAFAKAAMMKGDERELVALRAKTAPCGGCHTNFDGFGLTRYSYDTIGRFNPNKVVKIDTDVMPAKYSWVTPPAPLDNSMTVPDAVGIDLKGPVADSLALAKLLNSDGVRRRVAFAAGKFLTIYAVGHDAGVENSCALQSVKEHFYQTGSFKTFYRDLATSTGFVARDPGI